MDSEAILSPDCWHSVGSLSMGLLAITVVVDTVMEERYPENHGGETGSHEVQGRTARRREG